MNRSALAGLDLDPLDFTIAVVIPVFGFVIGLVLGLHRDYRREGLVMMATSVVGFLVAALLVVAVS